MENQENKIDLDDLVLSEADTDENGNPLPQDDGDEGDDPNEPDPFDYHPPEPQAPPESDTKTDPSTASASNSVPYSLSGGSSAVVGATPYGVHQTARRVVAVNPAYPFYQQSLTFELIDNIGLDGAKGGGRSIRISTDGTSILTGFATHGGDDNLILPRLGGIRAQVHDKYWDSIGRKESAGDGQGLNAFSFYSLTIQHVDPIDQAGVSNGANDWVPIDMSPTSRNADQQYTTSTSTGINVGMMGEMPSIGFSEENSSSRSWSLPDYDLFGVMGSLPDAHHASWTVTKNPKISVTDITISSFCPKMEAVFCLSPDKIKKRYSSVSIMTNFVFEVQDKNSTDGNVKNSIYGFVSTFIVDWRDGLVYPFVPADAVEDVKQKVAGDGLIFLDFGEKSEEYIKYAKDNKKKFPSLKVSDIEKALKPPLPVDKECKSVSFGFRPNSPIGFAVDLTNSDFVEGYVNDYGLGYFASGYRVSSGLFRQDVDFALGSMQARAGLGLAQFPSVALNLPFNNSVRIKGDALAPAYWLLPKSHVSDQVTVVDDIAKNAKEAEFTPTFDTVDVLGVPEAPDSLNCAPDGGNIYMLYRDHVFLYTNKEPAGRCSPIVYRAGAAGISSAVISNCSIAMIGGEIWVSRDQLKSFELKISNINIKLKPSDEFSDIFLNSFPVNTIEDFLKMTDDPRLFLLGGQKDPLLVVLGRTRGMHCAFNEMRSVIDNYIIYKKDHPGGPATDTGGKKAVDPEAPSIDSSAFVFDLQDPSYLTGTGKLPPEVLELVIHHQLLLGTGKRLISCLDLRSNSAPFLANLEGNNVMFSGPTR